MYIRAQEGESKLNHWTDEAVITMIVTGQEVADDIKTKQDPTIVSCPDCGAEHDYRERCPG